MKNYEKIVCTWCDSQNVEVKIWVNANTLIVSQDNEIESAYRTGWCNTCQKQRELKKVIKDGKKTQI